LEGSTLNVSDLGGFGATNAYTLLTYSGSVFGSGQTVGVHPYSKFISGVSIDMSVAHNVNLNSGKRQPPVANFIATNIPPSLAVTFADKWAGPITNRCWDFGDLNSTNLTATTTNLVHAYPRDDTYTVTLIAFGGTVSRKSHTQSNCQTDGICRKSQQSYGVCRDYAPCAGGCK